MKRLGLLLLIVGSVMAVIAACSGGAAGPVLSSVGNSAPNAGTTNEDGDTSGRDFASATNAPASPAPGAPDQPMIIYTGSLGLQVDDVRATADQADQLVAGL